MVWLQNYLETLFHPAATIAHTMKHRSLIQPAIALRQTKPENVPHFLMTRYYAAQRFCHQYARTLRKISPYKKGR